MSSECWWLQYLSLAQKYLLKLKLRYYLPISCLIYISERHIHDRVLTCKIFFVEVRREFILPVFRLPFFSLTPIPSVHISALFFLHSSYTHNTTTYHPIAQPFPWDPLLSQLGHHISLLTNLHLHTCQPPQSLESSQ